MHSIWSTITLILQFITCGTSEQSYVISLSVRVCLYVCVQENFKLGI